jgi:DNA gyrase subunit A
MDVGSDGQVIAMDVARDDMDLLVVTEAGYGKRTRIDQYRKTSRGAKGVLTIKLTEAKGGLAGALVVRPHQELVFISSNGMIQRTGVRGISQQGRSATGVRVMNPRDGDQVTAVALIVESEDDTGATTLDVEGQAVTVDGDVDDEGTEHEITPEMIGDEGATTEDGTVEEE